MSAIKRLIADAHDTARWMESQGAQNQEGARVLDVDACKARLEHEELIESLAEITRILKAMRYVTGLGKNQLHRLETAEALVKKAEGVK